MQNKLQKPRKIWMDDFSWKLLHKKARSFGFFGKGYLSKFIRKVAIEDLAFIDIGNNKNIQIEISFKKEE